MISYFFNIIWVCIVYMYVRVCVHVWRPETEGGCLPQWLYLILETESLTEPQAHFVELDWLAGNRLRLACLLQCSYLGFIIYCVMVNTKQRKKLSWAGESTQWVMVPDGIHNAGRGELTLTSPLTFTCIPWCTCAKK